MTDNRWAAGTATNGGIAEWNTLSYQYSINTRETNDA